ncbi:MAG: hypothetical protein HFG28_14535 [Eubacterium sp.]|nr:hypothetical protein [Eubacterium sp.]
MNNIEKSLRQIQEQTCNILSVICIVRYAVGFLNYVSTISDEKELGVIGDNIFRGMECLVDYQKETINRVDELMKEVEKKKEGRC